jgi:cytoskeleton protein RodZ
MAVSAEKLMQSVGTRLKQAREKKGFSLDEINARTRINARNLVAIESDEVKDISSPFFYRSFVRQYAEQVDLDFQALAPAVEMMAGNMRQPELPGKGEHQPTRVAPIQVRPKRDFSWVTPAAIFLGTVVLGCGAYAGWKYYGPLVHGATILTAAIPQSQSNNPADPPGAVGPAPQEAVAAPVKRQPKAGSQSALPAASKAPLTAALVNPTLDIPASDTSAKPAESIHLELAAIEPTWLSVSADGKQAYTGILEPTQIKVLDGVQIAKLRTGNAGGVNITFNGKEIGPIGPRGKTRTVVFTKTGYAVQAHEAALAPANHIGG